MKVTKDDRLVFDAIGFRMGGLADDLPQWADLIYTFEKNNFNGRESLQLNVRDICQAE